MTDGPRRIVIELTGRAWGGILELMRGDERTHLLIGSMYTDESAHAAGDALRMLDGRVEIGRPVGANDRDLLLALVADGTPGCVTRDQVMTAVRICALWRSRYRGERGRIPIHPSPEIERGDHRFDMERFRELVVNWENSNRAMREYPSRYASSDR